MIRVVWLTAFLDLPPEVHGAGSRFWSGVTGYAVSPARGDEAEFTTLLPPRGDPFVKVQRTVAVRRPDGSSPDRPSIHLDVHVPTAADIALAAEAAVSLGARVVHRSSHGYIVLHSPGGLTFCLVHERLRQRPAPSRWSDDGGHESLVDQVCVDIPAGLFESECAFWADITGWELRTSGAHPELAHLARPDGIPLRLLLQRLGDDPRDVVTAHLDLASSDRAAETRRHERLGAVVERVGPGVGWTVLTDPTGLRYCITDRDPRTGLVP
ncbi:VOC family protein [Humibacillus xanthopallidus]|uniref:VOC family protein n=1 Tax=Humibacillus xanthopallidus TaxID=412689 RepID=UPI0038517416